MTDARSIVFISYARDDGEVFALELYDRLLDAGFQLSFAAVAQRCQDGHSSATAHQCCLPVTQQSSIQRAMASSSPR